MSDIPRVNAEDTLLAMWAEIKDNTDPPTALGALLAFAEGRALSVQAQILEPTVRKISTEVAFNTWVTLEFQRAHPEYATQEGSKAVIGAIAEISKQNKNISGIEILSEIWKLLDQKKSKA